MQFNRVDCFVQSLEDVFGAKSKMEQIKQQLLMQVVMVIAVLLFDDAITNEPDIKAFLLRNIFSLTILAGITFAELLFVLTEVMPVYTLLYDKRSQMEKALREEKVFKDLDQACTYADKLTTAVQCIADVAAKKIDDLPPARVDADAVLANKLDDLEVISIHASVLAPKKVVTPKS